MYSLLLKIVRKIEQLRSIFLRKTSISHILGASISLLGAFYWALSSVKTRLELFGTVYKCDRKTLASRYLWYIRGATGAVRAPWQGKTTITWRRTTTAAAAFYNAKKKSKMVESKKHSFSKSPVLKIFLWKFYWLVLGLIGLVDAKGIDVPQPIWLWGFLT